MRLARLSGSHTSHQLRRHGGSHMSHQLRRHGGSHQFRRRKQEDSHDFEASLGCIVIFRQPEHRILFQKTRTNQPAKRQVEWPPLRQQTTTNAREEVEKGQRWRKDLIHAGGNVSYHCGVSLEDPQSTAHQAMSAVYSTDTKSTCTEVLDAAVHYCIAHGAYEANLASSSRGADEENVVCAHNEFYSAINMNKMMLFSGKGRGQRTSR